METMKKNQVETSVCLSYLYSCYRFCKAPYRSSCEDLYNIFRSEHFVKKWKGYKKDIGRLWLNMDTRNQIKLYNFFGLSGKDDSVYLSEYAANADSPSVMFLREPSYAFAFRVLHVFFNNHGINKQCAEFLQLEKTPTSEGGSFSEKNKCFGNSKNWLAYLFSLKECDRERIINVILENYKG